MFIILAIIGLSVLVFFHELGHFVVAKSLGMRVQEFGFGYPPRMAGVIKKGNRLKFFWGKRIPQEAKEKTIYSINWIPFGGFNKLKGELGGDTSKDSFFVQSWWKKALVGIAGSGLNIVFAMVIFSFLYFSGIPQDSDALEKNATVVAKIGIQIGLVADNSPAQQAGLKIGDIIISIDGNYFDSIEELQAHVGARAGEKVAVEIKRREETQIYDVDVFSYGEVFAPTPLDEALGTDQREQDTDRGVIGVSLSHSVIASYPLHQALWLGVKSTFLLIDRLFYGLWLIVKTLVTQQKVIGGFFGPVGITVMTAEMARVGYIYFLQFVAFLSVAIGVFQMIPFPALDGSRVLLAAIEGIRGKRLKHQTETVIISIGFYILVFVLLIITFREIIKLF
ncbi:site-2 protease family protein [Patescibacteria group bacterium AH-259-L07]|nr:site-2 protease family protein [Patescibacteria group bacterium AH-259-L07]